MSKISQAANLKRIRLLFEVNGGLMIAGSVVAAGIYAWLAQAWVNKLAMAAWLIYMACAFSYRFGVQLAFRKASTAETFNWQRWEHLYALGLFLTASGWGAAGFLLMPDTPMNVRYILAFIVVGLVAGGASNYSVSKPTTFAVMLPMVIPFAVSMLFQPHEEGIAIGLLVNVLMVLLISASFRRRDLAIHAWQVSDEKEILSRELVDTQAKATQSAKMAALGQMAAGIAHEINTPLAIISVLAQTMNELEEMGASDPETIRTLSNQIDETVTRIAKIVSGLRSFSRQDQKDPAREFEISDVFESTLELCRERFKGMGVKLNVQPLARTCRVKGHSTQLSQVLLNLLNNAADATEGLAERWISIETHISVENILSIKVIDAGSGIPAELHAKLMEPFFTTKEVGKGTGLGLSVAHGIMLAHKGSLTLDTENKNTCFVIQLPVAA